MTEEFRNFRHQPFPCVVLQVLGVVNWSESGQPFARFKVDSVPNSTARATKLCRDDVEFLSKRDEERPEGVRKDSSTGDSVPGEPSNFREQLAFRKAG